jgi:hypothetical protein
VDVGRERQPTVDFLTRRFAATPKVAEANIAALNAGHAYGETVELPSEISTYIVPKAEVPAGVYRAVTGAEAIAWGLVTGAQKAQALLRLLSDSPASPPLHALSAAPVRRHHLPGRRRRRCLLGDRRVVPAPPASPRRPAPASRQGRGDRPRHRAELPMVIDSQRGDLDGY